MLQTSVQRGSTRAIILFPLATDDRFKVFHKDFYEVSQYIYVTVTML